MALSPGVITSHYRHVVLVHCVFQKSATAELDVSVDCALVQLLKATLAFEAVYKAVARGDRKASVAVAKLD